MGILDWLFGSKLTPEEEEMRDLRADAHRALQEFYSGGKGRFGENGRGRVREFAKRHMEKFCLLDPLDIDRMSDTEIENLLTESRYAAFRTRYLGE